MLIEVTESPWSSKPNHYKLVMVQSVSLNTNTGGNEDKVKHDSIRACYFMEWFSSWKVLLDFVFPAEFINLAYNNLGAKVIKSTFYVNSCYVSFKL